ncbi:hypothetical protein HDU97_005923 [Phlyctochytrium planicorne]|nr:hypothetical protein HDU97_005923 [Phlyctochytrium planicorne]
MQLAFLLSTLSAILVATTQSVSAAAPNGILMFNECEYIRGFQFDHFFEIDFYNTEKESKNTQIEPATSTTSYDPNANNFQVSTWDGSILTVNLVDGALDKGFGQRVGTATFRGKTYRIERDNGRVSRDSGAGGCHARFYAY